MAASVEVEGERLRFNWAVGSGREVVVVVVVVEVQEGGVASILWLMVVPPSVEDQGSRRNIHAREKRESVYKCIECMNV